MQRVNMNFRNEIHDSQISIMKLNSDREAKAVHANINLQRPILQHEDQSRVYKTQTAK